MKIQAVSKYLDLAEDGLVSRLECPLDQGLLLPNLDNNDSVYLYCISCEYKKSVGLDLYGKILKSLKEYGYDI